MLHDQGTCAMFKGTDEWVRQLITKIPARTYHAPADKLHSEMLADENMIPHRQFRPAKSAHLIRANQFHNLNFGSLP